MSKLTKEEVAWIKKLQNLLDHCPSDRFGFYTIGDPWVGIYDRKKMINEGLEDYDTDLVSTLAAHNLFLSQLGFPDNVDGVCG